jgi:hypothetical protein
MLTVLQTFLITPLQLQEKPRAEGKAERAILTLSAKVTGYKARLGLGRDELTWLLALLADVEPQQAALASKTASALTAQGEADAIRAQLAQERRAHDACAERAKLLAEELVAIRTAHSELQSAHDALAREAEREGRPERVSNHLWRMADEMLTLEAASEEPRHYHPMYGERSRDISLALRSAAGWLKGQPMPDDLSVYPVLGPFGPDDALSREIVLETTPYAPPSDGPDHAGDHSADVDGET